MPGLGRKKAVETTEDEGPLAPSSVKLSAFNLSVEEKAERNRMSQELDEVGRQQQHVTCDTCTSLLVRCPMMC